jgi:two-component system OmpR family sensor kinase
VPLAEGHRKAMGLAVYTIPGQDLWLQVAQPLADFQRAQFTAAMTAGGTVVFLGLIASAILGWNIRTELRPITDFARAVEKLDPESSTLAAPRLLRSELIPAYSALRALLRRLQAKLRSERAFAAHAAHSLRTPLAGLSAQLEVAGATAPAELAARLSMATQSARRLAGVIDALLMMARVSDGTRWRTFDATELAAVATGPQIEVDSSQLSVAGPLYGDSDLLAVAVANLVDNAARHGARRVHIRAKQVSDLQCIEIQDDGPGMSKEKLAHLAVALDRFDQSGEVDPALGLGLTLAFSVARAHEGCLSLDCTEAEHQGFCARLKWPQAPRQES